MVLTVLWLAGCAVAGGTTGSSGSCAALLRYAGHTYLGDGSLGRPPATTGRIEAATVPGCDDGGGVVPARRVQVRELATVAMDRAVLFDGVVYVREGAQLPVGAPSASSSGRVPRPASEPSGRHSAG